MSFRLAKDAMTYESNPGSNPDTTLLSAAATASMSAEVTIGHVCVPQS